MVGGLVGEENGSTGAISDAWATGAVTTAPDTSSWVGGLFGYNNGSTITDVHATAAVSGSNTGGLAGVNFGTIADAYATGAVSSGGATTSEADQA